MENTKRLILAMAIQAEIEGMKIANVQQEQHQQPPSYHEGDFQAKAEQLRSIAYAQSVQL